MSAAEEEGLRDSFNNLSIEKLFETFKIYKRDVKLLEIENFWMEIFLSKESPQVIKNIETALSQSPPVFNVRATKLFQIPEIFETDLGYTQASREYRSLSRRYTTVQPKATVSLTSRITQLSPVLVNISFNIELAQNSIESIKSQILKNQANNLMNLKNLQAQIKETKIASEELKTAKNEFVRIVIEEGIDKLTKLTSPHVCAKFLKDSIKNGSILLESFRLKNGTMQSDLRKKKKSLKKHAELSSCLVPIDFELAEIEMRKFVKVSEEKRKHYLGLRHEERETALAKGKEHKKFLEASHQLKDIQSKINICEESITKLESAISKCENEIQQLKKSINDLDEKVRRYNAPTIVQYIEKSNDFDARKSELKRAKRREEIAKMKLQNMKIKYRQQIEINKNYP